MRFSVTGRHQVRVLWTMRVVVPLMVVAAAAVLFMALSRGLYALAFVDALLLGVNVFLAWIEWAVLTPKGN